MLIPPRRNKNPARLAQMAELEDLDAITANLYSEPGSPDQVDVNPAGDIKYLIATGVIDRTDVVVAVTVGETGHRSSGRLTSAR